MEESQAVKAIKKDVRGCEGGICVHRAGCTRLNQPLSVARSQAKQKCLQSFSDRKDEDLLQQRVPQDRSPKPQSHRSAGK